MAALQLLFSFASVRREASLGPFGNGTYPLVDAGCRLGPNSFPYLLWEPRVEETTCPETGHQEWFIHFGKWPSTPWSRFWTPSWSEVAEVAACVKSPHPLTRCLEAVYAARGIERLRPAVSDERLRQLICGDEELIIPLSQPWGRRRERVDNTAHEQPGGEQP